VRAAIGPVQGTRELHTGSKLGVGKGVNVKVSESVTTNQRRAVAFVNPAFKQHVEQSGCVTPFATHLSARAGDKYQASARGLKAHSFMRTSQTEAEMGYLQVIPDEGAHGYIQVSDPASGVGDDYE